MHKILRTSFTAIFVFLILSTGISRGETSGGTPAGESKVIQGVKATLIVTPGKNMVDLFLKDEKTGNEIRVAEVNAKVQLPDNSVVEKKLIGMKMGDAYSFMSSVNMQIKGTYSFEVFVKTGDNDIKFDFRYVVK